MKIASAQVTAEIGDIEGNFNRHLAMIDLALAQEVDLIVFPEMSLTAYCRKEGKQLVIGPDHPKIIQLKEIADAHKVVIVVGAPIEINQQLFIGSYILIPNRETEIYTKQFLHEGEDEFYTSSFAYNPKIRLKGELIQFAICADIAEVKHVINAKENQCTLYIPSIFYSQNGIEEGHKILSKYAKMTSLPILMSNYAGDLWGVKAGGKSAFWDKNGNKIAQLDADTAGLLLLERNSGIWTSQKIHLTTTTRGGA
ncbi:MAG: carbon-nitrogen hydrolase family protein [Saprospiraceae bacterium]|nr:carbon-nitrogen hydrolase family protein [Saprospiraceae bacterium]